MENNKSPAVTTKAAAEEPGVPGTPEALIAQLRAFRQQIPDFVPLPVTDTSRRTAHVSGDFVQASINAVGASPLMQNAIGRTADDLRRETEEAARWTAVEDELRAMLQGIAAANRNRRQRIGLTALKTYAISRQLVRDAEVPDLLPHVKEMQRLNKFGRVRRKTAQQPETPPATPPAPPASTTHG